MDMESISSVNSNYSSTESVKVKSAPVESAHTAAHKGILYKRKGTAAVKKHNSPRELLKEKR